LKKIIIFILLVSLPIVGVAMSFFTKQVLFSEVKGVVQKQGKPLANVEVIRSYTELDNTGNESVKTDENGHFNFPKVTKTLFFELGFFPPSKVVITQEIVIKFEEKIFDAWVFSKGDYKNGSEIGKEKINIICDLNNEVKYTETPSGDSVYGLCTFD